MIEYQAPVPCGINAVGGYCPFEAQPKDPLCKAHATYTWCLAQTCLSAEDLRGMRRSRAVLDDVGASIPGEMDE